MKKIISVLCIVAIALQFMLCAFAVDNDGSDTEMSLTLEKYTDSVLGVVYTTKPVTIEAVYDNGNTGASYLGERDNFIKKSWFRVETLDFEADLNEIYNENKSRENIIQNSPEYLGNSWRTVLKLDVTLNGTYVFCGWKSGSDAEGTPDFIERIDITEIELERPMAWLEGYVTGDFGSDVIANVVVKNIECGKGAEIKRYAFVKDYSLPPGAWPESLPPEYCNEYFDSMIADLYDEFVEGGLWLGDGVYSNEGSEIIPENNVYPIRDVGSHILFIEDTNGVYNYVSCYINEELKKDAPEINTEIVNSDGDKTTVKVDVKSEYDIARLDYAELSENSMPPSENGTDEYFLEKEKHKITGDTIELSGAAVVCAMDIYGNTSYKRVALDDVVNPDDWTYTVSGENATITGYSGSDAVVKIPAQIGGYTVKSIKGRSSSKSIFANPEQITEIIIPEGITSIDNYAFARCESLTSVTIPESVTSIGSYACYHCSALDSVELPNALEAIGLRAFYSCNALTKFSIPASVKSIGSPVISGSNLREISVDENNTDYCSVDGVLYNKDKTNLMLYPAAKESAEYRIPDTVKTFDEDAIVSTYNLREMYIPASLTEINSDNNFYQCRALENFYVDESNTVYTDIDGVLYNKAVTALLSRPAKNPNTEFVIPDTVTAIDQYGLFDLRNLTSLTIPSNVTSISSRSFGYTCNDLKDIYYGGTSENWDRLWSLYMSYKEYFPNAEIHYDVAPKPSASPSPSASASPSPSASTSPSPSASTSPSPSASTSPSPSASTSPSPSPTRDPYKWTVLSFTEEYRRVFISVGKNVEKGTPFTIIAAKYNGDELIDVVVDNFKTTEESGIGQSFTLSKDITPKEEGEYVKIMLWENTTSCKPLSDPYVGDIKVAAFPGAEGAGKYAKGARANQNIEVYHVTNLDDSGEGSFRDAVSERGRIVVFDVGGTINLTRSVDISGNVTVLGQTAPGDGITITGANVGAGLYENIIRYLRIRPTFINGLECDAFGGQLQDGIIDHCSTSYSIDECLTFYSNKNVTVQNCISSESLRNAGHQKGNHGYGGIWGGTNSSYHHNLMATHDSRAPRLDRQLQGTDVRNNIIYNWGETNSAYGGESVATDGSYNERDTKVNWVNNYYKAGAATASRLRTRLFDTSSPKEYPSYFYMKGNVLEGNAEITNDNTKGVRINSDKGMVFLDEPVEMTYNIPEETAEETYATLLSHVGASLPRRDETDARVINDVINGTGRIIDNESEVGGVMQYEPVYRTFEIPKEWKEANGMGDSAESDVVTYGKWMGYTWIEAYVNDWTEQQSNPTNPTVKLSVGASRVNVGEALSVSAEAAAQSGTEITQIDIYDNDVRIGTYTGASAAADIKINVAGIHYISAVAYNNKDEGTRSTPIAVNVVE